MAQSPLEAVSGAELGDYLENWNALGSMITRGRSFSGYERNCCFLNVTPETNSAALSFADVSAATGLDLLDDGRAIVATDWDGDGDLDLWTTNRRAPRIRFLKNNLPASQSSGSITFLLEGKTCNRDAVGAVLNLKIGGKKQTHVLRAGDGFVSQSSKRILFGLSENINAERGKLEVLWPGGMNETFEGIVPGSEYRIVQGAGSAQLIAPKKRIIKLPESITKPPNSSEKARIILTQRIEAPSIEYVDFTGKINRYQPSPDGNSPLLINLWASWCAPCVAELADFKLHFNDLQSKGLRILALTTEVITEDGSRPDITKAKQLVAKNNYPFEVGATDANGLRLLTVIHNQLFARERPLPLPSSFLFDKHGQLAAIYKGPIDAKQLITDIDLLSAAPGAVSDASFPFSSANGSELFQIRALDFAKAYQDGGYIEDARRETLKSINSEPAEGIAADPMRKAKGWVFLAALEQSQHNWAEAATAYQEAIELVPRQPLLKVQAGVVLWMAQNQKAADQAFAQAAADGATSPVILDTLGKAHQQINREDDAIEFFKAAIALKPNHVQYKVNLAIAYQRSKNPAKAVTIYREIIQQNENALNAKNNLAWILATDPDDTVRDGKAALALARQVTQKTGSNNPATLDTLAAAQAENGNFEAAVATISSAIRKSRARGKDQIVAKLREKEGIYRSRKPYRSKKEK